MRGRRRAAAAAHMQRAAGAGDTERYQTVYARHDGAVAAPTAGPFRPGDARRLPRARHRDDAGHAARRCGHLLPVKTRPSPSTACTANGLTLSQQTVDAIAARRARGGRVVAVGTTSVRTLVGRDCGECVELRARDDRHLHHARLRIQGGGLLLTNFHLPIDALDAGLGIRGLRPYPRAVRACNRAALSFQLWRCDVVATMSSPEGGDPDRRRAGLNMSPKI